MAVPYLTKEELDSSNIEGVIAKYPPHQRPAVSRIMEERDAMRDVSFEAKKTPIIPDEEWAKNWRPLLNHNILKVRVECEKAAAQQRQTSKTVVDFPPGPDADGSRPKVSALLQQHVAVPFSQEKQTRNARKR